jgi:hypothetical protein
MGSIFRAHPIFLAGKKVAEASTTNEDRTINAANQVGIDGVLGQSIGADEVTVEFDTVVPVQGMQINIDALLGVPLDFGVFRNGVMMLSNGIIHGSTYTSDSKTGESKGKYKFLGGAPIFIA